jgi:uncharacterized protein (TIGR00369 family)
MLARFVRHAPGFLNLLGGSFSAAQPGSGSCTMQFDIDRKYCHSGDIVQGGFVTAMLDMAMTHAAFTLDDELRNLSSLEIKTTYLEATRAGKLRVEGYVLRSGYKLAFLEGRMYDEAGTLTATGSSVAKLIRRK